jgi:hypothetical protein
MVRKAEGLAALEISFAVRLLPIAVAGYRHPHHDSWDSIKPPYLVDEAIESTLGVSRKRIHCSRTRFGCRS